MECFRNEIDIILERSIIKNEVVDFLESRKSERWCDKKCLFIHSGNGTGKTSFITQLVKGLGYNLIYYNSLDIKPNDIPDIKRIVTGSNIISSITKKNIVMVIDDIHFKTSDDKIISSLLYKLCSTKNETKLSSSKTSYLKQKPGQKKCQKQKECNDIVIRIPIICIGNFNDKKNREMGKICHILDLNIPSDAQMRNIITLIMPHLTNIEYWIDYLTGNLRLLTNIYSLYTGGFFGCNVNNVSNAMHSQPHHKDVDDHLIMSWEDVMANNSYSDNIKFNTHTLLTTPVSFTLHTHFVNDGDKSLTGLLFHENVIDYINNENVYLSILDNFCFADFIDRYCFKKQIWQLNELSFYIKTFKNNQILFENTHHAVKNLTNYKDLRFTKILTKYSTEYNNRVFFSKIINSLNADKKDVLSWAYKHSKLQTPIEPIIEKYSIAKLELNRLMKFINISITDTNDAIDDVDDLIHIEQSIF